MKLDIKFTPMTPEEEWDIACQKVANLTDKPEWQWLRARIFDEHLAWPAIMQLVADHMQG